MKEFIKKILNAIFPGVPTKTAGWISLAFLVVLITVIVVLCIWVKKTEKKDVDKVNIEQEPASQDNITEEKEDEPKVENTEDVKEEEPVLENKEETEEVPEVQTEDVKEDVDMKEEKAVTKKAKTTKVAKEEKAEEKPKTKKAQPKAKEEKTETKVEKKPTKAKKEKVEEKPVEENTEVKTEATQEEVKVKNQKYMVIYDKEKKDWVIKKTGAAKASKRCKTKKEALEFVEKYAENQDLNVSIKKKDGKFQKKY